MFENITSDLERKRGNYVRVENLVNKYLKITFQLGTLAVIVYRVGAWGFRQRNLAARWIALTLYGFLNFLSGSLTGIWVNPKTQIGRGFVIHNFSTIMVDAVSIGENFTINQGVTVGEDWSRNGKPTIGDNVFLGAGAKVVGSITLGNNVVVAANALVERTVPDNCTVVGVPARIISRDAGSAYLLFAQKNSPLDTR